jgi:hypothetical protein
MSFVYLNILSGKCEQYHAYTVHPSHLFICFVGHVLQYHTHDQQIFFIIYLFIYLRVFTYFSVTSFETSLHEIFTVTNSWLRQCATIRKAAGSIPDGFIEIFHILNTSGRTMALLSIQPLTEMSTRNISWGVKAAGAYG